MLHVFVPFSPETHYLGCFGRSLMGRAHPLNVLLNNGTLACIRLSESTPHGPPKGPGGSADRNVIARNSAWSVPSSAFLRSSRHTFGGTCSCSDCWRSIQVHPPGYPDISTLTVPEHTANKALGRGSHARGPGMQGTASHSNRSGGFGVRSRTTRVLQYYQYIDDLRKGIVFGRPVAMSAPASSLSRL